MSIVGAPKLQHVAGNEATKLKFPVLDRRTFRRHLFVNDKFMSVLSERQREVDAHFSVIKKPAEKNMALEKYNCEQLAEQPVI